MSVLGDAMAPRVLIVCSTTDGQTARICEHLRQRLAAEGLGAELVMIEQAAELDPSRYARIVIGARIRYGKHDPRVYDYLSRHREALGAMPGVFFSVNIVARKPEKNRPDTNPYVRKFLSRVDWRPDIVEVFAGRLDYPRYRPLDRLMIRFIMWLTGGPTRPDTVVEYTDWRKVEALADTIVAATPAAAGVGAMGTQPAR